jgi:hypothetical protein
MTRSPTDPERVADATARRLLERAIALDTDGPTLAQLRDAAAEAGISADAFDAAVAEWRAHSQQPTAKSPSRWAEQLLRNAAGLALGWLALSSLAGAQALVGAPWLVHKLTDPVGLAIGAVIAARLRARTATVVLGGLAVAQGAEFLMDLAGGAPAIHGLGPHVALMIAGVVGVAVGRSVLGRSNDPGQRADQSRNRVHTESSPDDPSVSSRIAPSGTEGDNRFMKLLWREPINHRRRLAI